jgi:transcriptional regulator with XRE-family HTH domain
MSEVKKANLWPDKLRELRKKRGWTQVEAAEAFGCAASTWIAWENSVNVPYRKTQKRLKAFFQIDLELSK